jgi:hypothetical protein
MFKKYNDWYTRLTPLGKLVVSFSANWLYWLLAWLIAERFLLDEKHSWKYHALNATWMSFFMTIPYNWKELKQFFAPANKDNSNKIS